MNYRDPIFKGATRPAMMLGVPVVPLIIVLGVHILLAMWTLQFAGPLPAFLILMFAAMVVMVLRHISSQDEQRLNQYLLRLRSVAGRRNEKHWGAHSISPVDFTRRK